jgi:hypothetical protein
VEPVANVLKVHHRQFGGTTTHILSLVPVDAAANLMQHMVAMVMDNRADA